MTTFRCVMLMFDLPESHPIQKIRARLDPASPSIGPHITLIFPVPPVALPSGRPLQLISLASIPQKICFDRLCVSDDRYLWLVPCQNENAWITDLSTQAHLAFGRAPRPDYLPHVTVGRDKDFDILTLSTELQLPLEIAPSEIILEEFVDGGASIIIDRTQLRPPPPKEG